MRSLLLCLAVSTLFASNPQFNRVIKGAFNAALFDVVEDYNGDISAVGFETHHTHPNLTTSSTSAFAYLESLQNNSAEQFNIITLSRDGTIVKRLHANMPTFNRAINVVKSRNDGYYIGGYLQNGKEMLVKLNPLGAIEFQQFFGTAKYDKLYSLIALRDEGLLALGTSMTSRDIHDDMFVSGLGGNDLLLTRFTPNGIKTWSHKYGTTFDDRAVGVIEMQDGTLITLGIASSQTKRKLHLMRLSEDGDTLWSEKYHFDNFSGATDLLALRNGNFLILFTLASNDKKEIALATFDIEHNLLRYKKLTLPYSTTLTKVKELNDGSFIAVGYTNEHGKYAAIALKLDYAFTPLWQKRFMQSDFSTFHNVTILRDSTIAIVGEKSINDEQLHHLWILLLNPDGTIALKSGATSSLYDALLKTFHTEIEHNILRITKALEIQFIASYLQFNVGVYTLTTVQKEFLNQFFKKLLPVLKPYSSNITALQINGHTSSEWRGTTFSMRYLNNADLSAKRAMSITKQLFLNRSLTSYQPWLSRTIESDAHAFAKPVLNASKEDKTASRRVSITISLD